jgi:hypothetical protein
VAIYLAFPSFINFRSTLVQRKRVRSLKNADYLCFEQRMQVGLSDSKDQSIPSKHACGCLFQLRLSASKAELRGD